eukprot:20490_1
MLCTRGAWQLQQSVRRVGYKYYLSFNRFCTSSDHHLLNDPLFVKIKHALIGSDNDLNAYQNEFFANDEQEKHHLIIQPTGSGKSLCFQLSILYRAYEAWSLEESPTMGIVITPTISLMEDQVQQIKEKMDAHELPLKISCYHDCLLEQDKETVIKQLKARYINMLYVTPESLLSIKDELNDPTLPDDDDLDDLTFTTDHTKEPIAQPNITHIVFDECHLIAETTIMYRPQYCYELPYLISEISNLSAWKYPPQIMALTASLTKDDTEIVLKKLGLDKDNINMQVSSDWNRNNLRLQIHKIKPSKNWPMCMKYLVDSFRFDNDKWREGCDLNAPAIIYCQTKCDVNQVTTTLKALEEIKKEDDKEYEKKEIESYHADCNRRERNELQRRFYDDKTDVLVSTNAFGLGVNKNNVNCIIHVGIPPNIQRYYQETGRAGRNRDQLDKHYYCYCFYDQRSVATNDGLIVKSLFSTTHDGAFDDPSELTEHIKMNLVKFYQMLQYIVKHTKNGTDDPVLTESRVQYHLSKNFEYIFGHNPANYYWQNKVERKKRILYDSEGVLVDSRYYIAILKQYDCLRVAQQEYFDVYIPDNLQAITEDEQENEEALVWFVTMYLKDNAFKKNRWNPVSVADIQSKWKDKQADHQKRNEELNVLSLKRIERFLVRIKQSYDALYGTNASNTDTNGNGNGNGNGRKIFDFHKYVKDIGFELENIDQKGLKMDQNNFVHLEEWDGDIKRQRQKWDNFKRWLDPSEDSVIGDDQISALFQDYFNKDGH